MDTSWQSVNNWERDGPGGVTLITDGEAWSSVSPNPCLQSSVQSPSPCILSTIHDSKNVFTTSYLHKQVKNIASINTSWYLQCIHFHIGPQKPQRKVTASYFYCQHISSCPSRCQAVKWEEAKMLWNSIFADLYCLLRSQFCSDRLQNRILASFSPGLTRVMSLLRKFREAERGKKLIYPYFILCQKWMLQQPS